MKITRYVDPEQLANELASLPIRLAASAQEMLKLRGLIDQAKSFCPVSSGSLRESIRIERRTQLSSSIVAGGSQFINPFTGRPVDYARQVHDGTSRVPPRPFLRQAMAVSRQLLGRVMIDKSLEVL